MKAIISRVVCANKKEMYSSISNQLDQGNFVYLIVPEQFTVDAEIDIFKELDIDATIKLRVTSFTKLINDIIYKSNVKDTNFISDQARYLFIQSILLERKEDLLIFGRNKANKKFAEIVIKTIDQILDNKYDLENDDMDIMLHINAMLERQDLDQATKNKLKDLVIVINSYQRLREESKFQPYDKFDMASSILQDGIQASDDHSNEFLIKLANSKFYYYRFASMSKKEMNILKNLDQLTRTKGKGSTFINLTLDPDLLGGTDILKVSDYEVFEEARKFLNKLSQIVDVDNHIVKSEYDKQNKLVNNIFKFNRKEIDAQFGVVYDYEDEHKFAYNSKEKAIDNVYINRANNTEDEVEKLAIEIKKDIYEKGLKFGDIAIICTDEKEYFNKIRRNFKLNRIPAFFDEKRRLTDNVIYKYIKSCISILEFGLNPDTASQLLKYSFWNKPQTINLYQDYTKRRKLQAKSLIDHVKFKVEKTSMYQTEDSYNLEVLLDARSRLDQIFKSLDFDIFDIVEKNDLINVKTFSNYLYKLVANPVVLESYGNYSKHISNEEYEENRLVWKAFISLLDDLYLLNTETTLDQFINLANGAIDNFKVGVIPPAHDKVFVGNISKSKINNIKKLYVVGMSNLYYPPRNEVLDIFSETEKENLSDKGLEFFENRESNHHKNLLAFYEILSAYEDELVFSYSLVNSSNESMEMAHLLTTARKIIQKENFKTQTDKPEEYFYSLTMLGQYMPKLKNKEGELDKSEADLYQKYMSLLDNYDKYLSVDKSLEYIDRLNFKKDNVSKLDRDIALELFNFDRFSVSQLERYNTNPYDHFISYGLRPREYDVFDISNREVGNIAHEFLDQVIKNRLENDRNLDKLFDDAMDNSLEEYKQEDSRNKYYLDQMKTNFKSYANHIERQLEKTPDIKVISELKFGYDDKNLDQEIKVEDLKVDVDYDGQGEKEVKLYGKIDRVDIIPYENEGNQEEYYRVIDYKTGGKKFSPSKVMKGIDMQLLLYLNAITNQTRGENLDIDKKALGAFYQRLNTNLVSQDMDDKDSYEIAKANNVLKDLDLDGILSDNYDLIFKSMGLTPEAKSASEEKNQDLYRFRKGSKLGSQKNIIKEELFKILFDKNKERIEQTIKEIGEGVIDLKTYKEGSTSPYDYSPYKTISKDEGLKFEYFDSYNWKNLVEDLNKILAENKKENDKEGQDE